jgi:hypothetical protein
VRWKVGDVVCVHANSLATLAGETWVGEVCSVHGDPADEDVETTYDVKQLGYQQVTSFPCSEHELCETVLTFEGPMCVECKVPY